MKKKNNLSVYTRYYGITVYNVIQFSIDGLKSLG